VLALIAVGGCMVPQALLGPPREEGVYYALTEDGCKLEVRRFMPEKIDKRRAPVILCHGFSYNGNFWHLGFGSNFAVHMAKRGYDIWVPSLRGAGGSTKPKSGDWTIDDYILKDVPAIIKLVKEKTGASKVTWIGHSMGGMIMFGYLERVGQDDVKNFVAIAAPMKYFKPMVDILEETKDNKNVLKVAVALGGMKAAAQLAGPLGKRAEVPAYTLFHNHDNMSWITLFLLREKGIDNPSVGVHDQMMTFLEKGEFVSADGKFNYTQELKRVTIPVLFIAGTVDYMAPPETVRYAFNHVSSKRKTFRILCPPNGTKYEYGHDDLVLGKHADVEVFPYIYFWLEQQAGRFNKACLLCH